MDIKNKSVAGTLESSDVLVEICPASGLNINVESVVQAQFGDAIHNTVVNTLKEFNVSDISISLKDRGALECTIRARIETALKRAEGRV